MLNNETLYNIKSKTTNSKLQITNKFKIINSKNLNFLLIQYFSLIKVLDL